MPKHKYEVRRRRGETMLDAFEREIADLDRLVGGITAGIAEFEEALACADKSDAEARKALRIAREEAQR